MLPKKVLLAEDDSDDRDFFFDVLKDRADVVLLPAAENGEDVFTYLKDTTPGDGRPDFILLDQNMPKRNGLQTVQLLKQSEAYQNIPVFIYSTYADDLLAKRGTEAGAVSVFPKPYTPEGYHQIIDAILGSTSKK